LNVFEFSLSYSLSDDLERDKKFAYDCADKISSSIVGSTLRENFSKNGHSPP
jgi:hypothetical protein